jgi:hypothetical protein
MDKSYEDLYIVISLECGSLQYVKTFFNLDRAKEFVESAYSETLDMYISDEDYSDELDGEITNDGEAIIRDGEGHEWRIVSIDYLVNCGLEGIDFTFDLI